jgi:anti-anti-sigma regulatory factor
VSTSTASGGKRGGPRRGPGTYWLVVARAPDSVMVRIDAELDLSASIRLGAMLTDLIVRQGIAAVAVDLRCVRVLDSAAMEMFRTAAVAASARGATLTLSEPPAELVVALTTAGLGGLVSCGQAGGRGRARGGAGCRATLDEPTRPSSRDLHPAGRAGRLDPGVVA